MSGVNATVAWVHEPTGDNYAASPTDSDYKVPVGDDHTITELTIDQGLQRLRNTSDPEIVNTIKTTFDGSFGVEGALGSPWYLNHVFGGEPTQSGAGPYEYTWTPQLGRCQSSRWFVGVNYLDGTADRELQGVVFPQMELSWTQDAAPRVSLTGFYANETDDPTLAPGDTPDDQVETYAPHALTLELPNSSEVGLLQEATLTLTANTEPWRGTDPEPKEAVIGGWETDLTIDKIVTGTSHLKAAYGGSSASEPQDRLDGYADATLDFQGPGTDALAFNLTDIDPSTYSWNDIGNADSPITDSIEAVVGGVEAVATSSEASAR